MKVPHPLAGAKVFVHDSGNVSSGRSATKDSSLAIGSCLQGFNLVLFHSSLGFGLKDISVCVESMVL